MGDWRAGMCGDLTQCGRRPPPAAPPPVRAGVGGRGARRRARGRWRARWRWVSGPRGHGRGERTRCASRRRASSHGGVWRAVEGAMRGARGRGGRSSHKVHSGKLCFVSYQCLSSFRRLCSSSGTRCWGSSRRAARRGALETHGRRVARRCVHRAVCGAPGVPLGRSTGRQGVIEAGDGRARSDRAAIAGRRVQ